MEEEIEEVKQAFCARQIDLVCCMVSPRQQQQQQKNHQIMLASLLGAGETESLKGIGGSLCQQKMPFSKEKMLKQLQRFFLKQVPLAIIVGEEVRLERDKKVLYFQCYIKLKRQKGWCQTQIQQEIDNYTTTWTYRPLQSVHTFYQYCQGMPCSLPRYQEVLFWESEQNKNLVQQLITLNNRQEQLQLICENPQLQMKALSMTPNRFLESINQFKDLLEQPAKIEWYFPDHLRELKHTEIYEGFKQWFENECKPIKVRRSALVVYGKRNLGKTLFAWSLTQKLGTNGEVLDKTRAIHVKNCFTNEQFKNQDKAQLLILDDIKYKKPFNSELWKQLMSGQPTANQEDKYCNINCEGGKPVIFLTNNRRTYTSFASNPDFENEAYFIDIGNTYIGPPNTEPQIKPKENRIFGRKKKLIKEIEKAKQKQKQLALEQEESYSQSSPSHFLDDQEEEIEIKRDALNLNFTVVPVTNTISSTNNFTIGLQNNDKQSSYDFCCNLMEGIVNNALRQISIC